MCFTIYNSNLNAAHTAQIAIACTPHYQIKAEILRQEDMSHPATQMEEEYRLPMERQEKEPLRAYFERQTREQIERILKMPFTELSANLIPTSVPVIERERKDKSVKFSQNPTFTSPNIPNENELLYTEESKKNRDLQKSANRIKYLTASGKFKEPKPELNPYNPSKNLKQEIAQMTMKIREKQELLLTLASKLGDGRRKCDAIKDFIVSYKSNGYEVGALEEYTDDILKLNDELQHLTLTQDPGTNMDIYDQLDDLISQLNADFEEAKLYYESQLDKQLTLKAAPLVKEIADLKKKNSDLAQQCNMLEENLSSKRGKLISPNVKTPTNDNKRENEIIAQKDQEIDRLKKRITEINAQSEAQAKLLMKEIADSGKKSIEKEQEIEDKVNAIVSEKEEELKEKIAEIENLKNIAQNSQISSEESGKLKEDMLIMAKELEQRENDARCTKLEYERVINEKDELRNRQKSEWAEIYSNLKQEIEDLKSDMSTLQSQNQKLIKQLEFNR